LRNSGRLAQVAQLLPCLPRLPPVGNERDRSELQPPDRFAAKLDRRQEQGVLPDVGGQVQQVHDLRHAGAGDVAEAGQASVVAGVRK